MNQDIIRGQWNQVKGKIKEKWGKLTDDDLIAVEGKRDQLLGLLQSKYGWAKNQAEEQLLEFENQFNEGAEEEATSSHSARP